MKRYALVLACLLTAAPAAHASTQCQLTYQGELCVSQVDFLSFQQQAFQNQYQSQWCWAASVAMIFAYQGHPVDQARIVSEVYGSPVNMPAQAGYVIAQQLNRAWVDDFGAPFSSRITAAYDYDYGYYNLSNAQVIAELDRGNPLVIGARAHAMVLTAIQYYRTPQGPYVVGGGVFDPWPGVGARALATDELIPVPQGGSLRFMASVAVTSGDGPVQTGWQPPTSTGTPSTSPTSTSPFPGCAGGGGGAELPTALAALFALVAWRRRKSATLPE
ncbi:MAG: hypothetical protein EP329_28030 [Deltaproteobacteria bacterium]|nr:MAG: hypothetical protein EP329_28030 [Deltaproteobacteria bacterium]